MTSEAPQRETRGTIVRGALAELHGRQLFDAVRVRVSPEIQAMMDHPPEPLKWVSSYWFEEMLGQAGRIAGRETVRSIAYELSRKSGGAMASMILKVAIKVFGTSPAALLMRLDTVTHPQFRGVEHAYEPEAARSGFVVLRHPEPVSDFTYAAWEGAYMFGKDLTGEPDYVVESFEMFEDGKAGRVRVRW